MLVLAHYLHYRVHRHWGGVGGGPQEGASGARASRVSMGGQAGGRDARLEIQLGLGSMCE